MDKHTDTVVTDEQIREHHEFVAMNDLPKEAAPYNDPTIEIRVVERTKLVPEEPSRVSKFLGKIGLGR